MAPIITHDLYVTLVPQRVVDYSREKDVVKSSQSKETLVREVEHFQANRKPVIRYVFGANFQQRIVWCWYNIFSSSKAKTLPWSISLYTSSLHASRAIFPWHQETSPRSMECFGFLIIFHGGFKGFGQQNYVISYYRRKDDCRICFVL